MDILLNIAAIIGAISTIFGFVLACTKGGRNAIKTLFAKNTQQFVEHNNAQDQKLEKIESNFSLLGDTLTAIDQRLQTLESNNEKVEAIAANFEGIMEASKQQCRNTLRDIYYKYAVNGHIPLYERKTADCTFQIYKDKLQGNSYAELLYGEICKLAVDAPHTVEEAEE